MGMEPSEYFSTFGKNACLPVILDGEVVGYVSQKLAEEVEKQLRVRKVMHVKGTVFNMEIALIKNFDFGLFPGLYIMTGAARFDFFFFFLSFVFLLLFLSFFLTPYLLPLPPFKYILTASLVLFVISDAKELNGLDLSNKVS